ncbi:MAG TPA: RNA methyltransferase [Firmicutes bacterium]|nr:RNA methyltransferase [Candidatus Fermentithermobacillaceae bacterium]
MQREVPWRFIKSLSGKKERDRTGMTVAEGPPSVKMALESGVSIEYLVLSRSFSNSPGGEEILRLAGEGNRPREVFTVPDDLFERMAETKSPQGVLCVLRVPFRFPGGLPASPWDRPLEVVGIDIQDPGNAGTLIRAASAVGASHVVFLGASADPFSPKCIRASAGTIFNVRVALHQRDMAPSAYLMKRHEEGLEILKTVPQGGVAPWDTDLTKALCLVFGNEARGLDRDILALPGAHISIPMPGGTESLNVAVASGMILYEALRQRMAHS